MLTFMFVFNTYNIALSFFSSSYLGCPLSLSLPWLYLVLVQESLSKAVKVFVHFQETAAARAAVQDMNGRFFAQRRVQAQFYDVDRFLRGDYR